MDPGLQPPLRTRVPNWMLATGIFAFSAATYFWVLQRVGPNLNDQLEAEAARQEAAERRGRTGQQ
jgi:hypothetical protein